MWRKWGVVPLILAAALMVAVQGDEAVKPDPARAYAHFVQANTYYTDQELERAVEEYKTALKFDPLHADTMCNLGSALQDLGDYPLSRHYYSKAVQANPYHAVAHFNLGLLLHDEDIDTAIEHYQSAVEMDPAMADAWSNLGSAYHREDDLEDALGCYQEAIRLYETEEAYEGLPFTDDVLATLNYHVSIILGRLPDGRCLQGGCLSQRMEILRRCLRHDPEHALCKHNLESALGDSSMTKASPEYVKALFDYYAVSFDESLKGLDYSSPEALREVLGGLRPRYKEVFDAGCGTGLLGPLFRDITDTLIGVDLSEGMLEAALDRDVYDALAVGEMGEILRMRAGEGVRGDLVVAADVLVYIGELEDIFGSSREYLGDGGILAFTCELIAPQDCDEAKGCKGWQLLPSGRFAHTKGYLHQLAERFGFDVAHYREMSPRKEAGSPVQGQLIALVKRGEGQQRQPAQEEEQEDTSSEL
ncbi:unnamed protein product [Ectocarpus sp. CCAP 1310/34]|nr:unnamed protein product [Ectocarpus sp. CCAP 1310/34]